MRRITGKTAPRGSCAGFTIVEALVAVSVLTTIIFAPMAIIAQMLIQGALTEDNVKANLLAQEAIEYVRYTRDTDTLSSAGGNWFNNLYSTDTGVNEYAECMAEQADWINGTHSDYCLVQCLGTGGTKKECSGASNDGFVDGISTTDNSFGSANTETCDRKAPKDDSAFTATLVIIVPPKSAATRYAIAESCVSWQDKNDAVRKVLYREAMFEWALRT